MTNMDEKGLEIENFNPDICERLQFIKDIYIHTPINKEFWFLLEDLMLQVNPESPRPKVMGCLLTGEPHSGKTTCVRQFKKAYLENVKGSIDHEVIIIQIPTRASLKAVMFKLGKQLKIPDLPRNKPSGYYNYPTFILVEKVAKKLWMDGTKLVIIDEFQNLFGISNENRMEILSGFNDLLNESHVPIILVGIEGVSKILDINQYDDEANLKGTFCSRFPEFKLEPWQDPDEISFIKLLHTILNSCGNIFPKNDYELLKSRNTRLKILELTGGLTGKIIHLLKWTARNMVRNNISGKMTLNLIEKTYLQVQARGW